MIILYRYNMHRTFHLGNPVCTVFTKLPIRPAQIPDQAQYEQCGPQRFRYEAIGAQVIGMLCLIFPIQCI